MGLLDRFRKEEKTHYVRDEAGKVVDVQREYKGKKSSTPVSDRLLKEAKKQKRLDKVQFRQEQQAAYDKAFRKARIQRMSEKGRAAGKNTLADRFSSYNISNNYNPFGSMFDTGMSTPKRRSPSKKKKKKKSTKRRSSSSSGGGYDMFDNWGYMK